MTEINRAYAHLESHTNDPRQPVHEAKYGATGSAPPAPAKRRHNVIMPQMDESMLEGTITRWLKRLGDSVQCGEPLFEVSTDKVDAEIPFARRWRPKRDQVSCRQYCREQYRHRCDW
jgi:hypothetical protein